MAQSQSRSAPAGADVLFSDLTTLRIGGPAGRLVRADSPERVVEAVRAADAAGEPLLVLGGGSNLVVTDAGFPGVVVANGCSGLRVDMVDSCGGASFTVDAGANWDDVVVRAVSEGWVGFEALSGIPGQVGAAPVQNIGAYGQELSGVLASVRVFDREQDRVRLLALSELGFGYRTSVLKRSMYSDDAPRPWFPSPRYVVLEVSFQTRLGTLSAPIAYPELARTLGVELGARVPISQVRAAVLQLRTGKGMVAQDAGASESDVDHDTWSAGSFFTNPILSAGEAELLPPGAPRFPVAGSGTGGADSGGGVKTSAAWLIEQAGFTRGFTVPGSDGSVSLSTKHTLAITNRGGGTAAAVSELARVVRDGVRQRFGVTLAPEPVLVGMTL